MKARISSIIAALAVIATAGYLIAATASPASSVLSVYRTKTFNTTTNRTDTSATISTNNYPFVEYSMAIKGTDSAYIRTEVDYQPAGSTIWLLAKRDTMRFGDATTTTGKAKGFILVAPYAATPIPGSSKIRFRNTLVPFAVADSTSAPSYTQTVLIRN